MNGKKNEEYKESQITTINIFGFTFYMEKIYFTRKHNLKKAVYAIPFYLQFLCIPGYFKHSNDTPKLNINYNI